MNHSYSSDTYSGKFSIITFLNRISSGRLAAFLFLAALATFLTVNLFDFPLSVPYMQRIAGDKYLDMQNYYNADDAYLLLQDFGEEGRKTQLLLLPTIDLFLPFILSLFGMVAITYLFRRMDGSNFINGKLAYIPMLAWLFDYMENFFIFLTVVNYPERLNSVAQIAGILTLTKTIFYQLTLVTLVVGVFYIIRTKRLNMKRGAV